MSNSTQVVFSRAVKHHLRNAYVSLLDRIDQFEIGAVFTYHTKPHLWTREELDFTGAQISDLLTTARTGEATDKADNDDGFSFSSETNPLLDEATDSSHRTVDIDLDLDAEVKVAFVNLGLNFGSSGKKSVKISVSLGSIDHISSNMFDAVSSSGLVADMDHPLIREAMDRGKTLFVISSVYRSEEIDISVSRQEDVSMDAKQTLGDNGNTGSGGGTGVIENIAAGVSGIGGIPSGSESLSGGAGASTTGLTITKRSVPSNIGFSVLKITIGQDGSLTSQAISDVPYDHEIHASYSDAFAHIDQPSTTGSRK